MSGGSYDYTYSRVEYFAEAMKGGSILREKFRRHLMLVAEAMRAVEWVDSGDCGPGDEDKDILAVLRISKTLQKKKS